MKFILALMFLLITSPVFATNYCDDANCYGCWQMNIDEDPITDDSGEGHTGALVSDGHPDYTASGKYNGGYDFDGTDDEIDCGDIDEIDSSTEVTVVGWVNLDALTNDDEYLYSKVTSFGGDGVILFMDDVSSVSARTDVWRVTAYGGSEVTLETPSNGASTNWMHIATTVKEADVSGLRLYTDGNETADSPVDTTSGIELAAGTNHVWLGNTDAGAGKELAGLMDEVAVFTRILNSTEINDIMDNGLAGGAEPPTRRIILFQ